MKQMKQMNTNNLLNTATARHPRKSAQSVSSAFHILLAFAFFFCANLHAQITIGGLKEPQKGSILDLNNDVKGGLVLSNVNLTDPEGIPADFPGMGGVADMAIAKENLKGAMIYNTNADFCTGVFVWDGIRWKRLGTEDNTAVAGNHEVKIKSPEEAKIVGEDVVEFEIESLPSGAKLYTWYVSDDNGATYEYAKTTTTPDFSTKFSAGNYRVKVVVDNCFSVEKSPEKNLIAKSISPASGSIVGGNYIYIYGNFPYASSDDYIQDGLTLHFDGINNTGTSDKIHPNGNTWIDLISGYPVTLAGTPGALAQWSRNGYTFDGAHFEGGLLEETTKNGPTPFGDDERTIESVFLTPDNQTDVNAAFTLRAGPFVYGGGNPNPGNTYIGQIYHDGPNRFIGINTRGVHDLNFTVSGANPLLQPSSINTVSSEYIPNPDGPNVTDPTDCNFQGRLYTNGTLMVSGKLSNEGIVPPTGDGVPPCGINTINAWARIGKRDVYVLNKYKILSVRLYNRALTQAELDTNSRVDQIRFIAPPTVSIGGTPSTEVVVLSPHSLMCKVPGGSVGDANVVVTNPSDGTTYVDIPGGYTYVNSGFYISSIDPIVGSAGEPLTLTGNLLNTISSVEVGGAPCTITNQDASTCKCTLPNLGGLKGDVDITVTVNSTDTYRFARMFEYK